MGAPTQDIRSREQPAMSGAARYPTPGAHPRKQAFTRAPSDPEWSLKTRGRAIEMARLAAKRSAYVFGNYSCVSCRLRIRIFYVPTSDLITKSK